MSTIKNGWYLRNNGSQALIQVVGVHESGDALCLWAFSQGEPFRYHPFEFNKEFVPTTEEYVNSIEKQLCPSHGEIDPVFVGSVDKEKNPLPDRWDLNEFGIRKCSYCGSIHPNDLIKSIKEFGLKIIEPTTKDYKWYVNLGPGQYHKFYLIHSEGTTFGQEYGELVNQHNAAIISAQAQQND